MTFPLRAKDNEHYFPFFFGFLVSFLRSWPFAIIFISLHLIYLRKMASLSCAQPTLPGGCSVAAWPALWKSTSPLPDFRILGFWPAAPDRVLMLDRDYH